MKVETIFAVDMREAAMKVRERFGPDAVVLQTTTASDGRLKLLVAAEPDLPSIVQAADNLAAERESWIAPEPAGSAIIPAAAGANLDIGAVFDELKLMRAEMANRLGEIQLGATHHRDPFRGRAMREMLAAGFGPLLSKYLSEKMPAESASDPMEWIKETLARNTACLSDDAELVASGGVIALVGPTGVGKTTTTAKLAAKFVMAHGSSKVAMITTDMFRIGAQEQLQIYGRILRVPVLAVNDEQELEAALRDLQSRHTVLIDTVGMSQRDENVAKQVALLAGTGREVKRILCLNAAATGETLEEVVQSYSSGGLSGCIMTKLDEAATMGGVLDVLVRHRLKVLYIATGQRVPEDLSMTTGEAIVKEVFQLAEKVRKSPMQEGEITLNVDSAESVSEIAQEVEVG